MNRCAIMASAVFASLAAYLICRSCTTSRDTYLGIATPGQDAHCASAQVGIFHSNSVASLPDSTSTASKTEHAASIATYPDSIWGSFRAKNNGRFHEILHGFETKGALAPIDLFVCDENGDPISGASVRFS